MKRAVSGVAVLAILAAGTAGLMAQSPSTGVIIQQIIVKVNGEIFTLTDLEQAQIQALRDKNRTVGRADLQNDKTLRGLLADVTPEILVDAVDDLLLVQRGRELGYHLTDDQFKSVLENVKKDNKLDDAGLKAALAQEGLSLDQYRQMMERTMIKQRVQQDEVMQHASLTDEEARQYYQKHPEDFTKPPTVMLREMFVAVPTQARGGQTVFNAQVDNTAKEKITAARDRVRAGEAFAKVAAEVSESATKDKGGLIGPINLSDMDPALKDVIDKLRAGDVTEPIRTAAGYQLFALESRADAQLEAFDKVRDLISQKVYAQRLDGETKKYLDKLRAQALIEWKHDDMRKLYEKALADMKAKS